ncbi:MAG TPA: YdcF family protein [Nocardioides sp.]
MAHHRSRRSRSDRHETRVVGPLLAGCVVLVWSEWQHRRWSRSLVGAPTGRTEAVVVLGFRNRGARANLVNRWRVRAALRSIDPSKDSCVVFSGGAVGSAVPEARLMAAYATELGYAGPVVLEETSRSTWENVAHVAPLVEHADSIKIVSQSAHALKARTYLQRQRPDLAARLAPASEHVVGEALLTKPVLAVHGLLSLRSLRRRED